MKQPSTRWWDYPAIICFSLAMTASVFRLETTNWTVKLNRLLGIVLLGIILEQSSEEAGLTVGSACFLDLFSP